MRGERRENKERGENERVNSLSSRPSLFLSSANSAHSLRLCVEAFVNPLTVTVSKMVKRE